jgi:hypothetical protein
MQVVVRLPHDTPVSVAEVPDSWATHVVPPSAVVWMDPPAPTATQVVALAHETAVLSVIQLCGTQASAFAEAGQSVARATATVAHNAAQAGIRRPRALPRFVSQAMG